jgi:hypothetical protein
MNIFLDTEFTDLSKPRLISLGLVSEDGQEFYRELTDTWTLDQCTLFVIAWVLPLMGDGIAEKHLKASLHAHLDLVRYLTDSDNQFPSEKTTGLNNALASQPDLAEHLSFLEAMIEHSSLRVEQDSFLLKRLSGLSPKSMLGKTAMPSWQAVEELNEWFSTFDKPTTIYVDNGFDKDLLKGLLYDCGATLPDQVRIDYFALARDVPVAKRGVITDFYQSKGRLHHALDDAKAMRLLWLAGKDLKK